MFAWRRLLKRRVIVYLESGLAFEGVLWRKTRGYIVLRGWRPAEGPDLIGKGYEHGTPADGETLIERRQIEYYQFPYGAG